MSSLLRSLTCGLKPLIVCSFILGWFPTPVAAHATDEGRRVIAGASLIFGDGFESTTPCAWSNFAETEAPVVRVDDFVVALGTTREMQVEAFDCQGDSVAFLAEPLPLPSGATLDSSTGVFSFTPQPEQVGSFDLTFIATDGTASSSDTVTVTVDPGAVGPTSLTGRVLDANDSALGIVTPIVGVTVSVLGSGTSFVTDAQGRFVLTPIGSGLQVLDLDAATSLPAPSGDAYASFREAITIIDGVTNTISRPLYLPRLDGTSATVVDPAQTTLVTNPGLGITLTVPPSSAKNPDGSDFVGELTISAVPEGFAPAELPSELEPGMLITIQPVGVVFDPPAPITFTDVDALAVGSETDLWSLDPSGGFFTVVGKGEVQADGTIDTMIGGVRAADWHAMLPPMGSPRPNDDGDEPCNGCCFPTGCSIGSSVRLKTGSLSESVALPPTTSQGKKRRVVLSYDSLRASSRFLVPVDVTIDRRAAVPESASYQLEVGGVASGAPVFVDTSGFSESTDETFRGSLAYDARHLNTGVYPARLEMTSHYPATSVSSSVRQDLVVVNEEDSPFGAGWGVEGLGRLFAQPDGSQLLVDGDGTSRLFEFSTSDLDVTSWSDELNYPDDHASWAVSPDGREVTQTGTNFGNASAWVSPFVHAEGEIFAQLQVTTGDDDQIGLVLGYRAPITSDGDPAGVMDFIVFDWKGATQTAGACGTSEEGFRLTRFLGSVPAGDAECLFWSHQGPQALPLASRFGEGLGWERDEVYEVRVLYERNRIHITVDGETIFDVSGIFPPGRVGFYNYSQLAARYRMAEPNQPTLLEGPPGDPTTLTVNPDSTFTRSTPDGTLTHFDSSGRQTSVVDRNGRTTLYAYDGAGRLESITDPVGQETTFTYAAGRLESITDPADRDTLFSHDTEGDLRAVTFPDGEQRLFEYDGHRMISQTDERAQLTSYDYDDLGRVERAFWPDGSERSSTNVQSVGFVGPASGVGSEVNPSPVVRPEDAASTYVDGEGRTLTMISDGFGQPVTLIEPSGLATLREYSVGGQLERVERPSGHVRRSTYDTATGNQLSLVDETLGGSLDFTYEPVFNQLETTTDTFGNTTTYGHDSSGNTTSVTSEEGRVDTFTYDDDGLLVTADLRLSTNPTTLTYVDGELTQIDSGSGVDERTTTMTYSEAGDLESITDAESEVAAITYDDLGRPLTMTLPDTEVVALDWDASGNLVSVTPPDRGAHSFTYTPAGDVASYQPPAIGGAVDTNYTYDESRRLTRIDRPDGRSVVLTYDSGGRLATRTVEAGTTTRSYDSTSGLVTSITSPGGVTLTRSHLGELLVGETWSGPVAGSYSLTLDAGGRVASEQVGGTDAVSFGYDDDSLLVSAGALGITREATTGQISSTSVGIVSDSWSYNDFGELVGYTASASGTPFFSYALDRDRLGRVTSKTETIGGVTTVTDYTYDANGRIEQVDQDSVLAASYTYDGNGNRLTRGDGSSTETGVYDAQDRASSYGGEIYTFRQSGELLTKASGLDTTSYVYDELGSLLSVTLPDNTVIAYVLDGFGRRIGRSVDGVLERGFLFRSALAPVAETDAAGLVTSRFVYGTRANVPDLVHRGTTTYRLVSDHVGSARLVVDAASGAIAHRLDYDEFGRVLLDTNPGFQPFGFAGGLYDPDTGLVRFGARDYDPYPGRWTARDPILFAGGSTMLYELADPINSIDPSGLRPEEIDPGVAPPEFDLPRLDLPSLDSPFGQLGLKLGLNQAAKVPVLQFAVSRGVCGSLVTGGIATAPAAIVGDRIGTALAPLFFPLADEIGRNLAEDRPAGSLFEPPRCPTEIPRGCKF